MRSESKEEIPVSDLDKILRVLKEKKKDVEVRKNDRSVIMEKGLKQFEIQRDGTVRCCLPLHSFYTHTAESIEVGEEGIDIHYDNGNYKFKI
ncbi:MAG: hypothetical protein ACLFSM_06800 [Thermoplasmata archaeon]